MFLSPHDYKWEYKKHIFTFEILSQVFGAAPISHLDRPGQLLWKLGVMVRFSISESFRKQAMQSSLIQTSAGSFSNFLSKQGVYQPHCTFRDSRQYNKQKKVTCYQRLRWKRLTINGQREDLAVATVNLGIKRRQRRWWHVCSLNQKNTESLNHSSCALQDKNVTLSQYLGLLTAIPATPHPWERTWPSTHVLIPITYTPAYPLAFPSPAGKGSRQCPSERPPEEMARGILSAVMGSSIVSNASQICSSLLGHNTSVPRKCS